MLLGQKRIDKDGVALTINERDSTAYPSEIFFAGRDASRGAPSFLGQQLPFQSRHVFPLPGRLASGLGPFLLLGFVSRASWRL